MDWQRLAGESLQCDKPACYSQSVFEEAPANHSPSNVFSSNSSVPQHDANCDNEQTDACCCASSKDILWNAATSGVGGVSKPHTATFASEDFVFKEVPFNDDMGFTHADYMHFLALYDMAFPLEKVSLRCMNDAAAERPDTIWPSTPPPSKRRAHVCGTPTVMSGDRCVKWCTYPVGHEGAHEGEEAMAKRVPKRPSCWS